MMNSTKATTVFSTCQEEYGDDVQALLLCISNTIESNSRDQEMRSSNWLLVLSGSLVFLMQLGFAMLSAGSVRRKNASNLLLKNVLDTCITAISFFTFGYAFAFGQENSSAGATFVGSDHFFLSGNVDLSRWFFQYTAAVVAVTITAGTLAERSRNSGYVSYSAFMSVWVYPVVAHSLWSVNGFISPFLKNPLLGIGCIDFAGSGVVHLTGGTAALVSSYVLGARRGRFYNSKGELLQTPKEFSGHSVSLQVMGILLLWFGWYGLNSGQSLLLHNGSTDTGQISDTAAANTSIAGAAAAITALLTNMYQVMSQSGRLAFDLPRTMHGALTGLVSVSAGAGVLEPWAACVTGIVAAWVYLMADIVIVKICIDDPVHGVSVHGFGGIWGLLSVGLLASPQRMLQAYGHDNHVGWFYSIGRGSFDANLLGAQISALIFIMAWTSAMIFPFFMALRMADVLRIDELEEIAGLDAAYQSGKQEDDEKLKADIREEFKKYNKESREKTNNRKSSRSSEYEDPVTTLSKRSGRSSGMSVSSNDKSLKSQNTASSADDVDV